MRGYRANYDFQIVLAPLDDVPVFHHASVLLWAEEYLESFGQLDDETIAGLRDIYSKRRYMNKVRNCEFPAYFNPCTNHFAIAVVQDEYMRSLVHYVAGYCCKGEKSPQDAVKMLKTIVTSAISGATTFSSIAHKFTQKLLTSRVIVSAEADFLLSKLPSYQSSFTFQSASLNTGYRTINLGRTDGNDAAPEADEQPTLQSNMWDKYLKAVSTSDSTALPFNFYQYVISQGKGAKVVPVLSYAYTHPTWPLQEDFARTVLSLYKTGLKSFGDVKGDHDSYVAALKHYLSVPGNHIPPGVIRSIQRAVISSVKSSPQSQQRRHNNATNRGQRQARQRRGDNEFGNINDDQYGESQMQGPRGRGGEDLDALYGGGEGEGDGNAQMGNFELSDTEFTEAPPGYLEDGVNRSHWPDFHAMSNWLPTAISELSNSSKQFSLPQLFDNDPMSTTCGQWLYFDPIKAMNNEGQRTLLTHFIRFWRDYFTWERLPIGSPDRQVQCPVLRAIVAGEAGTGKTYCMKIMVSIVKMIFIDSDAALLFAPTGVAAAACGGNVPDKVFHFSRTDRNFKDLTVEELTRLQLQHRGVKLVLRDEMSIEGQLLQGQFANRSQQIFNDGEREEDLMGGVLVSINLGDHNQLPPVLDTACFAPAGNSVVATMGSLLYNAHKTTVYLLDQNVRQQVGGAFVGMEVEYAIYVILLN